MSTAGTGERLSRRELLETIDKQNETLSRYETRLRDVVRAYKGLAKEKEALEKSLSALNDQKPESASSKAAVVDEEDSDNHDRQKLPSGAASTSGDQSDAESVASSTATEDSQQQPPHPDVRSLKVRVKTLASSLSTLSAEKSKLESAFQESKKKSMLERSEFEKKITALTAELATVKSLNKKELEELKSKWIVERHNREKESNDHALMLRELQKLVADERTAKEKFETELSRAKDNLKALELAGTFNAEYEKRVRELEAELSTKSKELDTLRQKVKETPPELIQLRRELSDLKAKHASDLQKAEHRSHEVEDRAHQLREAQEQRVVNLEARLQELSDTVGSYDRLRHQDQVSIQKLRERVQQLELEKTEALERLSSAPGSGASSPSTSAYAESSFGDQDSNLDVQTLIDRILRLKAMVRDANKRSAHPIDLEELLEMTVDNESAARWKKSYHQLKEEFESYKLKRESLKPEVPNRRLLSKSAELDEEEIQNLKVQVTELRNRLLSAQSQVELSRNQLSASETKEKELLQTIANQKQTFKEKYENQEQDLKGKILSLEAELQKQRDRCLALIEEKEDEVVSLKSNMAFTLESALGQAIGKAKANSPNSLQRDAQFRLAAAIAAHASGPSSRPRLLSSSSVGGGDHVVGDEVSDNLSHLASHQGDGMVLHYSQELSRCEVEISSLRKKNHDLESAMRELQMSFGAKEERYTDELETLREAVRRLKRMTTKEGANFEYLKNVVLNYMLSSDAASREHMLKAIGAVLIFSEAEIQRVRNYNASWWPSAASTAPAVSGSSWRPLK